MNEQDKELKAKLEITLKKLFTERIKEYRLKQGLTQKEIAQKLKISERAYGDLERGVTKPSGATFIIFLTLLEDNEVISFFNSLLETEAYTAYINLIENTKKKQQMTLYSTNKKHDILRDENGEINRESLVKFIIENPYCNQDLYTNFNNMSDSELVLHALKHPMFHGDSNSDDSNSDSSSNDFNKGFNNGYNIGFDTGFNIGFHLGSNNGPDNKSNI